MPAPRPARDRNRRRMTLADLGQPESAGLGINLAVLGVEPDPGVIASFVVDGRAVPWSAPSVTRNGSFSSPRMKGWKAIVREAAERAMVGREAYPGAVVLILEFYRVRAKARPAEVLWVGKPDLSNLLKSTEDALKSVIFVDDAQVVEARVTKRRGERDEVRVRAEKARGED